MADHEIVGDDERDHFAGTSATGPGGGRDIDGDGVDDRSQAGTRGDGSAATGSAAAGDSVGDYERGRRDEAAEREGGRFDRTNDRDDARTP
jgi:hypothetical protein